MAEVETCRTCVYSYWDPNIFLLAAHVSMLIPPACANHPESYGLMKPCPAEVCRNYRPRLPTPEGESVRTIPLGNGFYTYVDAADYEWLSQWTWSLIGGYAGRFAKGRAIMMHREIMQTPEGLVVDHKNQNRLDNTRKNLWNCTYSDNAYNRRRKRNASSRFRGVGYAKDRGKYRAQVCNGGKINLGYFEDEIEAARAHDHKAVEVFGDAAKLNFPEEWPPERRAEVHAKRGATQKRRKTKKKLKK